MKRLHILGASLVAMVMMSCTDDVVVGQANNPSFELPDNAVVYVTDDMGHVSFSSVDLHAQSTDVPLTAHISTTLAVPCPVSLVYDEAALIEYNGINGTSYEAVPQSAIALSDGGVATIAPGQMKSQPITLTITSDGSLEPNKPYVVPLKVTASTAGAQLSEKSAYRLVFVKDLTTLTDGATKYVLDADGNEVPAARIMCCLEVNDTNPLNLLSFRMKKSGKYFYDAVMLFAANINYNEATDRVYINCNENVQAILNNRDKYIKPLQDVGMKVYLSILGNHDRANVNNLADDTARDFAKQIKAMCDAYQLDGVFYNSEYASPIDPAPQGFVNPSNNAAGRLFYEVKKLQPERDNIIYTYDFRSLPDVDGAQVSEYMDFIWNNYRSGSDYTRYFSGFSKWNYGLYSNEMAQGSFASENNLRTIRNGGYGLHVHFATDPNRSNFSSQLTAMQRVAKVLLDDEVVFDGNKYPADWK